MLVDDVYRNSTKRPSGRGLLRGRKDPRGRPRDAASAAQRNLVLDILSLGVSTGQFASVYILINYERECADLLVFERGLARERAEPSDFEGKSAHTLMKFLI